VWVRCIGDLNSPARRPDVEAFAASLTEDHDAGGAVARGIMIVGCDGLTTQAAQYLRDFNAAAAAAASGSPILECFTLRELRFNIMDHYLMPDYTVLASLPPEVGVDRAALPQMLSTDPVARYLGLRPGALLRVVRPNASAGRDVTYRHVV
jgi:DNA-directed RNA polymerase I, II, and III subunit RPABC1